MSASTDKMNSDMSKKKTQVHWVNPSNPYFEAKFKAWEKYSDAYHSNAGILEQQTFYKEYVKAKIDLDNNPQTIFNDE